MDFYIYFTKCAHFRFFLNLSLEGTFRFYNMIFIIWTYMLQSVLFMFPQKYKTRSFLTWLFPHDHNVDFGARCSQVLDRISFSALKEMTLKYCSLDTGFGSFTAFLSRSISLKEIEKKMLVTKMCLMLCQHSDMTQALYITIGFWASIVSEGCYIRRLWFQLVFKMSLLQASRVLIQSVPLLKTQWHFVI